MRACAWLQGFEDGKMATALGYTVLGAFGMKARLSCPMMRSIAGEKEGWSIPNIGQEGVARLGMHGSDSGIYDANGQFDENKFQEMLRITGADKTGIITEKAIIKMQAMQYQSWFSHQQAAGEFSALFAVMFDGDMPNRTTTPDRMRQFYEGTLLYESVGEKAPWLEVRGDDHVHTLPRSQSSRPCFATQKSIHLLLESSDLKKKNNDSAKFLDSYIKINFKAVGPRT